MVSISLKTKKSFIAHPWRLLSVVGLEKYSAHDWRAATSVQRAPVTWREWGLWVGGQKGWWLVPDFEECLSLKPLNGFSLFEVQRNCVTSWSYVHLPYMNLPIGQKLVKFGTFCVQILRNEYLWKRWMDLLHAKLYRIARPEVVQHHGPLLICPMSTCSWARNLANLAPVGSKLCGTHISETTGSILSIPSSMGWSRRVIRTLHDCPSQMNENLLISNSKLTSDSELIWWR